MKINIRIRLLILLVLVTFLSFSQNSKEVKARINERANGKAKSSKYEINLYHSLFEYHDYIKSHELKPTTIDTEVKKKLNTFARRSKDEISNYQKTYNSLDLTTKSFRKKHYEFFNVDANNFLVEIDLESERLKNSGLETTSFAKKTSKFIHDYSFILDFKEGDKLTSNQMESFKMFDKDNAELSREYEKNKASLKDEFKVAHKSTGIIDNYSKKALFSEVYVKANSVNNNSFLKKELERMIFFYQTSFEKNYETYHQQFPNYFLDKLIQMKSFYEQHQKLGFSLTNKDIVLSILKKESILNEYIGSSDFEEFVINKNTDLFNYVFVNKYDNINTFETFRLNKSEANSNVLSWLMREETIFKVNYSNYKVLKIIAVSSPHSRFRWGVWEAKDGTIIKNAYALKQEFIISYQDLTSNKCFASNFTAVFLESNNVVVSSDDIQLKHKRQIKCK